MFRKRGARTRRVEPSLDPPLAYSQHQHGKSNNHYGHLNLLCNTKMIRRFFILCLCAIMHCINEDFTIPLHTLITDIVDGQGGSALLIRILNRLGVCSSLESLNRYMQDKRANRENCINHALSSDSFTVISLDNIDFVHSYARIFKSSWHGTSIQAVQPLPSLSEAR